MGRSHRPKLAVALGSVAAEHGWLSARPRSPAAELPARLVLRVVAVVIDGVARGQALRLVEALARLPARRVRTVAVRRAEVGEVEVEAGVHPARDLAARDRAPRRAAVEVVAARLAEPARSDARAELRHAAVADALVVGEAVAVRAAALRAHA